MPATIPKHARADPSAQDEKPTCALQLKLQACRPSTYLDVVTRSRYPEAAAVAPVARDESKGASRSANDVADRLRASAPVSNHDGREKAKECSRSGRVRKHVHFAEDEGYASATGTPAPTPKLQSSSPSSPSSSSHQGTAAKTAEVACGERPDDRGRVLVKSGSARVLKPQHSDPPQSTSATQPSRTVTSRKATSQPRTSKAKKRPRTDKTDTSTATSATERTGGSYRNQYGNIVFEDFF